MAEPLRPPTRDVLLEEIRRIAERAARPGTFSGPAAPRPEVTVAMPARNTARYVSEAIASVLLQADVDLELIVVDDGSTDGTAEAVGAFPDPRVRLLVNRERHGIGYSHNRVLAESRAPFVTHVDSDDVILPGALRKALDAVQSAATVGQAYAHLFELDEHWQISPEEFERQKAFLLTHHRPDADYRRNLLVHGMVVNPLRTYRREVFDLVGQFDERLPYAVDYEMAVRIADRYDVALVPEFLYCQRVHQGNVQENLSLKGPRFWWRRARIVRRLLREGRPTLLGRRPTAAYGLLLVGLVHAVGVRALLAPTER